MPVTSGSWDGEKVFLRDQVLEVRNVDGRLHIARKPREYDEWDPYYEPYDPYGPGANVSADVSDKFIENVSADAGTVSAYGAAESQNDLAIPRWGK
jgi:hypothetical protein